MVYFNDEDLGWRPMIVSWLAKKADPALAELLSKLVDRCVLGWDIA